MRVLVAEDEVELARGIKYLLEKSGFAVDVVHDGQNAWERLGCAQYDAAVLDIMMPKMSGIDVLAAARRAGITTPVMMLTAKSTLEDKVAGLNAGADDYLPKPFASQELIARVKALSRRSDANYAKSVLTLGSVQLDCSRLDLVCGSRHVRLSNKEFQLLELFMRNPRHVFSTERLMGTVWGLDCESSIDVVWTTVGFVRKKLRAVGADVEIKTMRGAGYSLEETAS
ncbi:MAG: response regulator transcription factor [Eggerthellaceae bacterium]|nr:response regulator transcription factor [Eggerthellaceae bacterium]